MNMKKRLATGLMALAVGATGLGIGYEVNKHELAELEQRCNNLSKKYAYEIERHFDFMNSLPNFNALTVQRRGWINNEEMDFYVLKDLKEHYKK